MQATDRLQVRGTCTLYNELAMLAQGLALHDHCHGHNPLVADPQHLDTGKRSHSTERILLQHY